MHVVLRVVHAVGNLRTRHAYRAMRGAIAKCAARSDYRIVHASIQSNHLHLLVEADDRRALSRGMQGFAISAAKRLNRELRRRRGDVFAFRYHATPITSPTQARNALAYILNNWRRHRHDIRSPYLGSCDGRIFSSSSSGSSAILRGGLASIGAARGGSAGAVA